MVNVFWGFSNLVVGYLLVCHVGDFDLRNAVDAAGLGLGIFLMAVLTARLFGRFQGGDALNRSCASRRPAARLRHQRPSLQKADIHTLGSPFAGSLRARMAHAMGTRRARPLLPNRRYIVQRYDRRRLGRPRCEDVGAQWPIRLKSNGPARAGL